ncbi:phage tail length tape measure family protein [Methylobacterium sp. CM6247]
MANNIAIRLGVEGGADVRRAFEDAGGAGRQAFDGVTASMDKAGVASDRLAQKTREAQATARAAQAAASASAATGPASGFGQPANAPGFSPASLRVAERVRAEVDAEYARQIKLARTETGINTGYAAGRYDDAERDRLRALAAAKYAPTTDPVAVTTSRSISAGWRDLEAAGAATLKEIEVGRMAAMRNAEASRRLGALGLSPQTAANQNRRLRSDETTNLMYQGGDIVAQLGSGSGLGMIALQQGPQIAQIFAGPGGASIKGAAAQASEAVSGFVSRIGLVGGAIGVTTAAVITGAAAFASYRSQQREVEIATSGIGRASGATVGAINAIADAQAGAAGLSRSAARDLQAQFAGTGQIGTEMYAGLLASVRDYANATRQDLPEAGAALAVAFADPTRGAEKLNAQLGFLDDTALQAIGRLQAQGDRLGAQKMLLDAYSGSVAGASQKLGFFARQWQDFKTTTSNEIDGIGRFIDRGLGGGDAETRLKTLQAQLKRNEGSKGALGGLLDPLFNYDAGVIKEQIAKVQAEIDKATKEGGQTQANQRSFAVGNLVRSLNPEREELKKLTSEGVLLRKAITDPIAWGLKTDQIDAARRAFGDVSTVVKNLVEDMDKFGSRAVAALNRTADFNLKTVGYAPGAQAVAATNDKYDQLLRDAKEADRAGIETARQKELETLRQSSLLQPGNYSTSVRDIPEQYRDRVSSAANSAGIDASLLASVFRQESRFRPEVIDGRKLSPAGAAGPFQFMPGTATQYGVDPLDFTSAANGAARLLRDRLKARNGDVALALADYNWGQGHVDSVGRDPSRFPKETRNYIADVTRQTPGLTERVQDLDANARAVQLATDNLKANTELYGVNGQKLEATTRANEMLSQQMARGIPVTDSLRASILQFANDTASAAQKQRLVQFASDSTFEREQLGRSASEQSAFAAGRRVVGDTSSDAARAVIETTRMNDTLRETKTIATDAFGGLLTDLRQGRDLMSSLGNATGRWADRLLTAAADKSISAMFAGSGSGGTGGGIASVLASAKSFLGFDQGGYTGPGGRLEAAGIVHKGELVWSQDDIRRVGGVASAEALRKGFRGYDLGGFVGDMPGRPVFPSGGTGKPALFIGVAA